MAKSTTSREFAHEDLAVLPGVGGDHEMTQRQAPVNHYLSLCLGARCGPPRLSGSDSRCFMRSSCTASGPANPRYGDRTRDLHGFSAAVLQHACSGPLCQSRCALRSTMPAALPHTPIARTRCPHTMGPLCRALRACSAAASCTARVPAHGLSQVALRVASSVPARGPSHARLPTHRPSALCSCARSFW